jgi:hypothetical protein
VVGRSAWLETGEPLITDRVASLPLWIEARDLRGLFPSFTGSLDAAWLGGERTHLALSAWYVPPLGVLGSVADRALLHRVAEAVARNFLEKVAERLLARPSAGAAHGVGSGQPAVSGLR